MSSYAGRYLDGESTRPRRATRACAVQLPIAPRAEEKLDLNLKRSALREENSLKQTEGVLRSALQVYFIFCLQSKKLYYLN